MFRVALALVSCLGLLLAAPARAEAGRTVGILVSPVGAYRLKAPDGSSEVGYSAGLVWGYRKDLSPLEVGGHVASSARLTEATPMSLRFTPPGSRSLRPYVGLGLSFMVTHGRPDGGSSRNLQLGPELCVGATLDVGRRLFVGAEGRYQNFAVGGDPFSGTRQALTSGYLGLGVHL